MFGQKGEGTVSPGPVIGPPLSGVAPDAEGDFGCLTGITPTDRAGDQRRPDGRTGQDGLDDLCLLGDPGNNSGLAPYRIQPIDEDDDTNVFPMVGGSLELMTPRFLEGLGRPRLFTHVDLAGTFGFTRRLAGTGDPLEPLGIPNQSPLVDDIQEDTVVGQGSRTNLKTGDLMISAGAGIAFTSDVWGRRIRVKPSFEYVYQDVRYKGLVQRAIKQRQRVASTSNLNDFRLIVLTARDEKIIHGFGPGLEIEADTLRMGPFMTSVYALGRGYYFPDSLDETLSASNEWGESATWTFELEPWAWRAGLGFRLRWLPD